MSNNSTAPKPQFRFNCNIRSETGVFLDLAGGGGQNPAVIAYQNDTWETNPNQIWTVFLVPYSDDRIIIKNSGNNNTLIADGEGRNVRCEYLDDNDESDSVAYAIRPVI
ncbi:hard-surface inducible [Fusarium longipes]|uniref:Hard-surface inducible n=1 Tax=Fusarium longipes TaxID=694270 RepID=A0A395TAF2_9HYPO|nr:hard-surface inducible [Fusarium longipes]